MKKDLKEYDIIISFNYDNIVKIDNIINEFQPDTIVELKQLLNKITILKYRIVKQYCFGLSGINVIMLSDLCHYPTDSKRGQYKLPLKYGNSYIITKEV